MALRWDPLLVRALARELDDRLAGCRLRALRLNGDSRDMVLLFRELTLAWSLHPEKGAPLLLPPAEPDPGDLSLPSRVRRVRAPADERIIIVELVPRRGGSPRDLRVELLGNQWNALVVEGPEARIRHVLVRREGPRVARVGASYAPPPPSPRVGGDGALDQARWREILEPAPPGDRPRTLVASIAWTSPLIARALVDGDPDPSEALTRGHALWSTWVGSAAASPVLLDTERGPQPYPFPVPGIPSGPTDTLLDAFRLWSEESPADGFGGEAALPADLVAGLERATESAQRRRTSLAAELDRLEDPSSLRIKGDLLLARFSEIPAGAAQVTLDDFQGGTMTLELDPTRPVQENAAAFYDRAARVERALERIPALLEEAGRAAERLAGLLERARRGEATAEELRAAVPRRAERPGQGGGPQGSSLPYRSYRSSGGLEIRVGRGSKHNDAVTFRYSAPDDIWLHARHAAGAHVVLRWGRDENPPARDLEEAAVLAALHSKARTSGTVPVDWTRRKYVRKPRGAPPGSVVMQRAATLFVAPDERLLEKLSAE